MPVPINIHTVHPRKLAADPAATETTIVQLLTNAYGAAARE
jgi:hypothetical protein